MLLAILHLILFSASLVSRIMNLVSGNGFGFAVVSPRIGGVTKFYAHPYSFVRPDPQNPLSEGIQTANFLKSLRWGDRTVRGDSAAEYEGDSHVIHIRNTAGDGFFFMPLGFTHPALIVSWQRKSANSAGTGLTVEWSHPIKSHKSVPMANDKVDLLKFDGIDEILLLLPLEPDQTHTTDQNVLAACTAWAMVAVESENELDQTVREFESWRADLTARQSRKARG